ISGCHAGNVAPDFRDKETIINRSGRILARTQSKSMPPPSSGASLSNEEIESIECWVSDGSNG
ncbi:MAG: 2-polyprenyl-6-methoxyphenol hydroxylase, partial [Bacteroidota bacterium]